MEEFHALLSPEMPRLKIEHGYDNIWSDEEYERNKPKHFPKKSRGVYLLYHANGTLLYVGLALNGFDYRVWGHEKKIKSARYIDFIAFSDKYAFLAPALEYFLISNSPDTFGVQAKSEVRLSVELKQSWLAGGVGFNSPLTHASRLAAC